MGHHVAMYCGNRQEVEASINEKGMTTDGEPGDQTGREFLIRSYRNYPWTNVLRYKESSSSQTTGSSVLRKGSKGEAVKEMQQMLITCGYSCGPSGADGDFENATYNALVAFQQANGLIADGEYGSQSRAKLLAVYAKKKAASAAGSSSTHGSPSRTPQWVGRVTASALNVRTWAGAENPRLTSWPLLHKGNLVDVRDTVKAKDGTNWHYIRIAGRIYGFVAAQYIVKN